MPSSKAEALLRFCELAQEPDRDPFSWSNAPLPRPSACAMEAARRVFVQVEGENPVSAQRRLISLANGIDALVGEKGADRARVGFGTFEVTFQARIDAPSAYSRIAGEVSDAVRRCDPESSAA